MKKKNESRKLNLNKKVILLLNKQQKMGIRGGTVTEPICDESYTSCDNTTSVICTRSTIPGAACPSQRCTTAATDTCTK